MPVWQPVLCTGDDVLLPAVNSHRLIARVMQPRFYHAVHQNDPTAALVELRTNRRVASALDSRLLLATEYIRQRIVHLNHQWIGENLAFDFWSIEQLAELRDLIQEYYPSDEHMMEVHRNERLFMSGCTARPSLRQCRHRAGFMDSLSGRASERLGPGPSSTAAARRRESIVAVVI